MNPKPGPTNASPPSEESSTAHYSTEEMATSRPLEDEITEPTISPCEHMEHSISALSDNSLRGLPRWYTQLHASYCPKCGSALRSLRKMRERLRLLQQVTGVPTQDALTPERRAAVEQAIETADSASSS